jgi:signal transduction histidine kinase
MTGGVEMAAQGMRAREPVNILLVDDQPGKLLSYEAILAPLGENLIQASSGKEALEHLLRTDIAVVLIDVCMPDLDGFELATMIREHPRYQRTAIIFVSAVHLSDIDRLRGFECGAVDYVGVPVEPEILRARVGVFADLHRKTRQLEWLNQELERRVAERTSELTAAAARLRESEAALRDRDRRKDEFLAMLAHELRNPLAPIRNVVELLRQQAAGGREVRWSYEVIERQLGHLSRLVDDLLDVSRITRGKLELRPEAADLRDIARAAAEAIQPAVAARDVSLRVSLPVVPVPVRADTVRMTQVVLNLLDNACKFTPAGGAISLTVEREDERVRVSVRDSGAGIAAGELPRLFQMFYQSDTSTAPSQGGLGIGLALVKLIVEMHHGSVEATSEGPGLGSEFVVRLPVAEAARKSVEARPEAGVDPVESTGRRILVVDDNEDNAETLAMLLRRHGHEVRTAHDGEAAVVLADVFGAEVVLLDIGLPVLDGYQAARAIREQPWGKAITLVAVTGWGQEHDRQRSRDAGFDAHLVKPVNLAELMKLVLAPATETRS